MRKSDSLRFAHRFSFTLTLIKSFVAFSLQFVNFHCIAAVHIHSQTSCVGYIIDYSVAQLIFTKPFLIAHFMRIRRHVVVYTPESKQF